MLRPFVLVTLILFCLACAHADTVGTGFWNSMHCEPSTGTTSSCASSFDMDYWLDAFDPKLGVLNSLTLTANVTWNGYDYRIPPPTADVTFNSGIQLALPGTPFLSLSNITTTPTLQHLSNENGDFYWYQSSFTFKIDNVSVYLISPSATTPVIQFVGNPLSELISMAPDPCPATPPECLHDNLARLYFPHVTRTMTVTTNQPLTNNGDLYLDAGGSGTYDYTTPVPEPGTLSLTLIGAAALLRKKLPVGLRRSSRMIPFVALLALCGGSAQAETLTFTAPNAFINDNPNFWFNWPNVGISLSDGTNVYPGNAPELTMFVPYVTSGSGTAADPYLFSASLSTTEIPDGCLPAGALCMSAGGSNLIGIATDKLRVQGSVSGILGAQAAFFFGLGNSDLPFTGTISFTLPGATHDDFRFATDRTMSLVMDVPSTQVPEPSTIALCLPGLFAVSRLRGWGTRRNHKRE